VLVEPYEKAFRKLDNMNKLKKILWLNETTPTHNNRSRGAGGVW
jgi:hypothetical protein